MGPGPSPGPIQRSYLKIDLNIMKSTNNFISFTIPVTFAFHCPEVQKRLLWHVTSLPLHCVHCDRYPSQHCHLRRIHFLLQRTRHPMHVEQ